jgi:pyridoxamine 5'-phosphate oxidase
VSDPFALFAQWWEEEQVPVVVATASPDGLPTARAVVLEQLDERGFVFWSSSESPKGRQLAANPRAALVFLWDGRQVRVEGRVERVPDEENARHWAEREGKRPLAAFDQSEPVESRAELERLVDETPEEPERPDFWVGYRVVPERFDVWEVDPAFVHDRHEYVREGDGWIRRRLQP